MKVVLVLAFLSTNYLYQANTDKDWEKAKERSFFQFVAIIFTLLILN